MKNINIKKTTFFHTLSAVGIFAAAGILTAAEPFGMSSFAESTAKASVIYQPKNSEYKTGADGTVISEALEKADEIINDESSGTSYAGTAVISKGTLYDTSKTGKNSQTAALGQTGAESGINGTGAAGAKDTQTAENGAAAEISSKTGSETAANTDTTKEKAAANTSIIANSGFGIFQTECYDNLDMAPVLSGGEVRFLANLGSSAQQLSAVFKSSDGRVIVVDGGQKADTEHLVSVIKEFGGKVDAWLITHPQTDHVGALNYILESGRSDIGIDGIYYNFADQSWYDQNDPDESGMVRALRKNLAAADSSKLHSDMKKGSSLKLSDRLSFTALNEPQLTEGIFAGNSSGIMYDICIDGKHFIILGDMAAEAGNKLMREGALDGLICDYVQISHHGQTGVSDAFYNKLNPKNCIWPTNEYIYYAGGVTKSGLGTTLTKMCISKLKVERNFVTLGRDVIIK